MPAPVGLWLGRRLGDLAFLLLRGRRRRALANLRQAMPELSPDRRRRIGRRSFQHLGMMLIELCRMHARPLSSVLATITLEGLATLQTEMAAHGRALILTAHLGNWELLTAAHRLTGFPLAVVVRPLDAPWLDALAERLRLKTGVELIDKRRALRPVLGALARGRLVGILLDQNASRREGVFVPFFGRPASTSKSLALLALRTRTPIVPIFTRRVSAGRHEVRVGAPIPVPDGPSSADAVREITARCTQAIEAAIRQAPEQWLWVHHRWRTAPPADGHDPR